MRPTSLPGFKLFENKYVVPEDCELARSKKPFSNLRNRYSRQTMFRGIGDEGQAKLSRSCAVIIVCGALGSNIATFLVRAGVGKIRIIDRDFIEYHNLQRQTLFDEDDITDQLPKAVAAERHLKRINSTIDIEGIVADVNYTNAERFCSGADVILDGLDNFEGRFLINDVALKQKTPWIYGGAIGSTGMTMTIIPGKTACLRCIISDLPDSVTLPTCETAGVLNTTPALIGSLQATEALKILVNAEVSRGLTMVDVWKGTFDLIKTECHPDCPACYGRYDFLEKTFKVQATSLCGQTRAVQVVDASVTEISFSQLASRLRSYSSVSEDDHALRFRIDDYEITVFQDGRAIIKNTTNESLAKELYDQYVKRLT
ncbi:MAG: ThiF family adenylyltransferase [Dehalococcoidales bacterium]|nr:ThiF family adenylyltransferase [Dehalococcoidales bacterium]